MRKCTMMHLYIVNWCFLASFVCGFLVVWLRPVDVSRPSAAHMFVFCWDHRPLSCVGIQCHSCLTTSTPTQTGYGVKLPPLVR